MGGTESGASKPLPCAMALAKALHMAHMDDPIERGGFQ
jgi:hypothetical protein